MRIAAVIGIRLSFRIVLAGWLCLAAQGENAVLECTADTWVAQDVLQPQGRTRELRLRSDRIVLLDFRFAAIQGWTVRQATLLLHLAGGRMPGRVRISPASSAWRESETTHWPDGKARYDLARVRDYGQGWMEIPIDPRLAGRLAAGKGHGLALRGATRDPVQFDSRETIQYAPYLLVEGSR